MDSSSASCTFFATAHDQDQDVISIGSSLDSNYYYNQESEDDGIHSAEESWESDLSTVGDLHNMEGEDINTGIHDIDPRDEEPVSCQEVDNIMLAYNELHGIVFHNPLFRSTVREIYGFFSFVAPNRCYICLYCGSDLSTLRVGCQLYLVFQYVCRRCSTIVNDRIMI